MTQLFATRGEGTSLADAVSRFSDTLGSGTVALVYTPSACLVGALESAKIVGASGAIDASAAFEARVFSPKAELRWLHPHGGEGSFVVLSEEGLGEPALEATETLDGTYLLWGTGTGRVPSPGWSEVAESRIGALQIPVHGLPDGGQAVIRYREYIAIEDEYGNAAVVEERLLSLEVVAHG